MSGNIGAIPLWALCEGKASLSASSVALTGAGEPSRLLSPSTKDRASLKRRSLSHGCHYRNMSRKSAGQALMLRIHAMRRGDFANPIQLTAANIQRQIAP